MVRFFTVLLLLFCVALLTHPVSAQSDGKSVVIGTMVTRPDALLVLNPPNGNQGLLIPQLTTSARVAITPDATENGLLVFDITDKSFYFWKDTQWIKGLGNEINTTLTYDPTTHQLSLGNGNTIDLSTLKELPDQSSQNGKFLTTNGTSLSWANINSLGDITGVTVGAGLTGGASSGDVSLNINTDGTTISLNGSNQLQLSDVAVTSAKIKDASVTPSKITSGANNTFLQTDATGNVKWAAGPADSQTLSLASNSITIANGNSVNLGGLTTGGQLSGTLSNFSINANAVTTTTILDGTIATTDLANLAVTGAKIADATISSVKLDNSGVTAGTYGTSTQVAQFTVDLQGRIKSAGNVLITGAAPVGAAGGDLSGNFPNPAIAATAGNNTISALNNAATTTLINSNRLAPEVVLASESPAAGDVTGSFNAGLSLANNSVTTIKIANGAVTDAKISSGVAVAKLAPSTTNGQVLTTSGGATVWANLPSTGTVLSVATGTGLTGGPITSSGTIALSNTGVTASSYGTATSVPQLAIDAQGRVTTAAAVTISGVVPGGAAGGDLSGTYPNPTVTNNAITSAKILDLTVANNDLATNAVSTVKIADGAVTAVKLANTTVNPATYGSGTQVPQFVVDAQGRITSASNVVITGAAPTGAAAGDLTGTYPNPSIASTSGVNISNAITSTALPGSIAGIKISPDFGTQVVKTSGSVSVVGGGTLSVAGTSNLIGLTTFNNGINVTGAVTLGGLGGGTNMVVAGPTGILSTQPIPVAATTIAGDVTGPLTSSTVAKIRGVNVSATAPGDQQVLRYDQATTQWVPATVPGIAAAVGFKVQQNNAQTFLFANIPNMVTWDAEQYDDGNNFGANLFVAPTAGVYHFDVVVSINNMDKQQIMEVILRKGLIILPTDIQRVYANTGQDDGDITGSISTDVKLAAGDQVHVWVQIPSVKSSKGSGLRTQFSGRKIY